MACILCMIGENVFKRARKGARRVLVLYDSERCGDSGEMAEAIAEGARFSGVEADTFDAAGGRFTASAFERYTSVAFGSADYSSFVTCSTGTYMDDWYLARGKGLPDVGGKPFGLFYACGGDADTRAKELPVYAGKQVGDTVECQGKPDAEALERCRRLGAELAASV